MNPGTQARSYLCFRCLYRQSKPVNGRLWDTRPFTSSRPLPQQAQLKTKDEAEGENSGGSPNERQTTGRMSERLAQMTEESIEQGGRGAEKAVEDSGFSEELKRRLEAKILDSKFKSDNPAAFAQANMPSTAGEGTRNIAAAEGWTGTETLSDSALRMLNDAHKPLRSTRPPRIPQPNSLPTVDMRIKKAVRRSQGERLANARDRTSVYALSQDSALSEKEREQMRKTLKERFTTGAPPIPSSVQGLAALANERIEDAISRGQFKNIPRGKGTNTEKDHNANSPFLDTTEYFMNKIIKKQEIVPPWIEKQQELVKAANVFRSRLRADWKRHAARVIASKGGLLEAQVKRAEAYAAAEAANNPKATKQESFSEIDADGRLSQVTVTETAAPASSPADTHLTISEDLAVNAPPAPGPPPHDTPSTPSITTAEQPQTPPPKPPTNPNPPPPPSLPPFRDPTWLALESPYHTLSITTLNNLTRSYNLQAPSLAKKPYFSLPRELASCFADITPQLPDEIRERARRPEKVRVEVGGGDRTGGGLERVFSTERGRVWDERRPRYGFREFWRDVWGGEGGV